MLAIERYIVIRAIDRNWQDHLTEIEDLRKSINLRSYGQRDPLNDYKSEAFTYFEQMMSRVRQDTCGGLFTSATNVQSFQSLLQLMQRAQATGPTDPMQPATTSGTATRPPATATSSASAAGTSAVTAQPPPPAKLPKVVPRAPEASKFGRNDLVTIKRGAETQQVKFKKAEQMLKEGWVIVPEK